MTWVCYRQDGNTMNSDEINNDYDDGVSPPPPYGYYTYYITLKDILDILCALILSLNSTGTLLASTSRSHSISRSPQQRVSSNNSSPQNPTTHLHHTSRF